MPDFVSGMKDGSYPGPMPAPPAPPAVAATALPAGVPALGLGLSPVLLIVAGDVSISTLMPGVSIQRR